MRDVYDVFQRCGPMTRVDTDGSELDDRGSNGV